MESQLNKAHLMKQLRRAHMYAGLFMTPWVLLYGLSGFAFNHSSWFPIGNPSSPVGFYPCHAVLERHPTAARLGASGRLPSRGTTVNLQLTWQSRWVCGLST